jgi:concanavalin A-like lectin/glucanase superfamily protein
MLLLFVTLGFLCIANNLSAQVIVETFEEASATTAFAGPSTTKTQAVPAVASSTISIGVSNYTFSSSSTSSCVNAGVSLYTTWSTPTSTSTGTTAGSTYGPDSTGIGTYSWFYGGPMSISSTTSGFHSSSYSLILPNSSFLISPTVSGGIAEVTFWVTYGGGGPTFFMGLRTGANSTNFATYPTTSTNGSTIFSLNTSSCTFNISQSYTTSTQSTTSTTNGGGHGSGSNNNGAGNGWKLFQVTYTVPATLASLTGAQFYLQPTNAGPVEIDDIEIFSPITITLGTMPTVCYSTSSQSTSIPYSATSGGPTTYNLSGWSNAAFTSANPASGNLSAAPNTIPITVPASAVPGTYTANLTVSDGTITSTNYSVSVTVINTPGVPVIPTGTTSYYDFTGNGNDSFSVNNGTLVGSPTLTTGHNGQANSAYTFNGSTQYVSTTNPTNSSLTAFSISAWFNTSTLQAGNIIGDGTSSGNPGTHDKQLYIYNGKVSFGVYNGGVDTVQSASTYNDGNWHMATATFSTTAGISLYVDGVLVSSNAAYTTTQNNAEYWQIGDMTAWYGNSFFTGSIDNVVISNTTAYTAAQVALLYAGHTISSNTPVCINGTVNLTLSNPVSGYTYAWTGPNSFTSSSQNPSIASATALATGTYYVTISNSSCTTVLDSTVVTVANPTLTLSSATGTDNQSVCSRKSTAITNITYSVGSPATGAGVTGLPTGLSGSYSSGTYTINGSVSSSAAPGNYTYTVTTTGSACTAATATGSIVVNTTPGFSTVPSGVTSFYKLDANANDTTGADNGTFQGSTPTSTTDWYGNANSAYTFDGSTQYISTATPYNPTTAFTISGWFKTTTSSGTIIGDGATQVGSSATHDKQLFLYNGHVVFGVYNGATDTIESVGASYNDGNWHMATGTFSSTSGLKLYVDGVLVSSNASYTTDQSYSGYWKIGYMNAWYGNSFFTGSLDNVVISNTAAITATQVAELYQGLNPSSNSSICTGSTLNLTQGTSNAATYAWTGPSGASFTSSASIQNPSVTNFNATDSGEYYTTVTSNTGGCTLKDSLDAVLRTPPNISTVPSGATSYYKFSGNANDTTGVNNGTLQNSPTITTDRYGNATAAYTFNGTSQYVSTTQSYVDPTTFSISIWFKTTVANNGVLIGFGSSQTGSSAQFDRYIWMNGGKLVFYAGSNSVQSPSTYNDGNWHLATATLSPAYGENLYVDGSLVASNSSYNSAQNYTGWWMMGYSNASYYFNGSLDDAVIYNTTELTASQVSTLYSGTSSNSTVCPGSTLSLGETTISGATYLWSGTGTFSASTSTQNPTVTSPATGTYSVTVTGSNGCTSAGSTLVTVASSYVWTGITSSNWSTGSNWTCGNAPISTSNVTIPNVAPTYPQPVLTGNVTINNIADSSGATVGLGGYTLTINGALTGTGTISGSSTSGLTFGSTASSATLYMTSAANTLGALTLGDSTTTHHTITLGNALNIASTGTLTVGSTTGAALATGGFLTLVSDNSGSARVAAVPVSGGTSLSTISGSVNVQCYIHSTSSGTSSAIRAWRLLTAPVSDKGLSTTIFSSWQNSGSYNGPTGVGTLITVPVGTANQGANGVDTGINGHDYSLYTWTASASPQTLTKVSNTKVDISGTNGTADNIGYFIFIRGDRNKLTLYDPNYPPPNSIIDNTTLSASGLLQLGDQTFSSGSMAASGSIYLVGNPYASSVDFSMLAGDSLPTYTTSYLGTNTVNRFYIWNSSLTGTEKVGGYVCIDDPNNTNHHYTKSLGGSGTASQADKSIQSGQAFFIQNNAINTAAAITFKEFAKNTYNNFIFRPEDDEQTSGSPVTNEFGATLSLHNADGSTSLTDGVVAQFNNAYCSCVDYVDAPKFSNIDEMFSLARDGKQLCIERRPEIVNKDTLFLNLKQMAQRDYEFNFTANLPNHPGIGAHVEDSFTHVHTPLNMSGTNTLDFTIGTDPASQAQNRFMVVFGALNITPAYTNISATRAGNTVEVQWSLSNDNSMTGYALQKSTDGINYTTIYTTTALHNGNGYSFIDTNPVAGVNYYRVLSTDNLNEESYSTVVSVTIAALDPTGITVYPNPIAGGQIGLSISNLPSGNYRYRLLSNLGQEVQTGSFTYSGGNATVTIPLNKSITHGTYPLEIFSPANTKTVINVVY